MTSTSTFGFRSAVVVLGSLFGSIACSSDSAENTSDDGGTPTTGPSTTSTMTATVAGPTTVGTVTSTSASTSSSTTVASTTGGTTTGVNTTGASTTGASTTGVTTTGGTTTGTTDGTNTGTATSSGAGGMGSTGSMSGAGGTGTTGGNEDFDPTAEDFTCIADWQQVLRFRINNFLGNVEEAVAVAEDPAGGVYPVGTIIQHFPTEAMVKRHAGFSPATKDWEFFLLTLNQDGTTTIANRGTTEITTMGTACADCHATADDQWDFVCNTYAEASGDNCGFPPFQQGQLDQAIANDPRCD